MCPFLRRKNETRNIEKADAVIRLLCILGIAALLSIVALVQLRIVIPAAATLCYGFLTIRLDDTTILDFMKYAVRYFISTQQYFEWR